MLGVLQPSGKLPLTLALSQGRAMFIALVCLSNQVLSLPHLKKNGLWISGAFSNPKDYHLPIQRLTHRNTQLEIALLSYWPSTGNKNIPHLSTVSLGTCHYCLGDCFLLICSSSPHNLDFFNSHAWIFFSHKYNCNFLFIFTLSRYLVLSSLNFFPCEEN